MPARGSRCSWDTSAEGEMRVMRRAALRLHRSRRLLSDADRPDQTTLAYSMAGHAAQGKFTEHQSIQSLVETLKETNLGGSLGDNVSNVVGPC